MAGHSKWANIKHKKGAADKKKGKLFSKITKEIMVAARTGGGDVDANARLRAALTAAKAANMPNANIERAIKKGTGELEGETLEEITYEGYGAGGVAFLVECMTDNRNRSASDVRMTFDRNSGNLAGSGAVTWMFHRKSQFVVTGEGASEENLMELLIDAGLESVEVDSDTAVVIAPPESLDDISQALEGANIKVEESGIVMHPENTSKIEDAHIATQVLRLVDKLEDLDDVQAVYTNIEASDEVMEQASEAL
jgi:YebC/PmpR family DNA-binding regulatory protein